MSKEMKEGYTGWYINGDDKPVMIHVDGIPEGDYVRLDPDNWVFQGDPDF